METDKEIKRYIARITTPIFNKSLSETSKNRMMVGTTKKKQKKYILYQPHNYRLYIDFEQKNFNRLPFIKTEVKGRLRHKIKNRTECYLKEFYNCNITVKKTQIEIINKVDVKKWHIITLGNIDKINDQIKEIIIKKDSECIIALKQFIKEYGGRSKYKILNRHSEDKIKQEDKIDQLPINQTWHTDTVKKVYKASNVEFNNPVYAAQYIRNRSIEDIAPDIARALYMQNPLRFLKDNTKSVSDVLQHKDIINILSDQEKEDFNNWLFNNLGVGDF